MIEVCSKCNRLLPFYRFYKNRAREFGITTACKVCCKKKEDEKHPLYSVWTDIKSRCLNPKSSNYQWYGKRGISIYPPWIESFQKFQKYCLSQKWKQGLDIDRIRNDEGYVPDNIRFVSRRKNCLNRRTLKSDNTSGFAGVYLIRSRNRWGSEITIRGKRISLGSHISAKQAAIKRDVYIIQNNLEDDYKLQVLSSNKPEEIEHWTKYFNSYQGRLRTNSSGYTGVYFHKTSSKWISSITIDRKRIGFGSFVTVEEAATARDQFIIENGLTNRVPLQILNHP